MRLKPVSATFWLTTILGVLFSAGFAIARAQAGNSDPQQILESVHRRSALLDMGRDFTLEADFTVLLNAPTQGKILLHWRSKDQWRQEIKMGPFEMVKTKNGEQSLTLRNVPFTPSRVYNVFTLLHVASWDGNIADYSIEQRHESGRIVNCIDFTETIHVPESTRACIDPATGDLVSVEHKKGDGKRREEYSDYVDFEGLRYPRQLRLIGSTGAVVSINVTRLAAEPFDVKLLDLPRQAIARRECDGETPPKEVSTPEVDWPRGAPPGNVSAALTVLEDGSVGDVRLIGSSTQQMNDTVIKALKAWKFKPAMCGADPVVADIEVAVSMRRY